MEIFRRFFRSQEDGSHFNHFGMLHLSILAIFIIGIFFIYQKTRSGSEADTMKLLKVMALVLLVDQIILYSWQIFSGYFRWDMSLPFYHCRIIVFILIFGAFLENKDLLNLGMYLGLIGSITSLIMVDLYDFSFPHFTNFQFFTSHIFMGLMAFTLVFTKVNQVTIAELKEVLILVNIMNVIILLANLFLLSKYPQVNYGYMMGLPEGMSELFPAVVHQIVVFTAFNIATMTLFKLVNFIILINNGVSK